MLSDILLCACPCHPTDPGHEEARTWYQTSALRRLDLRAFLRSVREKIKVREEREARERAGMSGI
jgi:hypothetical protein